MNLSNPIRWRGFSFWIGFLFFTSFAWSSGFYLPSRGVHSISRGGASFAGADSLQSIWYNPANLTEFKGWNFLLDTGIIAGFTEFQRADRKGLDGETKTYPAVSNQSSPVPDPSFLMSYGWKDPNLTLAFGFYAPYATPLKYPDTGPQRYALVDMSQSLFTILNLALAWSPHPRFRVGIGLQNYSIAIKMITAASAYMGIFGDPEDTDFDLYSELDATSWVNISGNVGLWGRVWQNKKWFLDVALSAQLPVFFSAEGTLKVRLPTHALFDSAKVEGNKLQASFWLPAMLRAALRIGKKDTFDLEVAFVYETWSMHDKIIARPKEVKITNVPAVGDYVVPELTIQQNFRDSFSIRLGGEYKVSKLIQLRMGYAFETTAIPDTQFSVLLTDSNKHLVGIGISFLFQKWALDLSYGHYFQQTRNITNSEFKQINPLNPEGSVAVGNGIYKSFFLVAGLGFRIFL